MHSSTGAVSKICKENLIFIKKYFHRNVYHMPQGQLVGNKAKGRISKWVFQENYTRQIFRKTNISYPLIRTRTCAYQGVRKFVFRKTWRALFSWNTRFRIRPFAILPTNFKTLLRRQSYLPHVWHYKIKQSVFGSLITRLGKKA